MSLPPSPEAHQFRAELYRRQARHQDSAAELRQALQLLPGDPGLQRELATSLYLAKSYEEALALLEQFGDRHHTPDTLFLRGDTLLLVGRPGQAIGPLERAVALRPSLPEARGSLGRAYLQSGKAAAAIPHLEAALKGGDEDGSLHYQLAQAYHATGQPDLARKMLEKYAEIQKKGRPPAVPN